MRQPPGRLVLLGHPVSHSFSPAFQNAALRRAALPIRYETMDVTSDALDATLDRLIAENVWGNVTIPHKQHVAARCTRTSDLASRVGAVNTFWIEDGTLVGDNTDVGGFLELLHTTAPDIDRAKPVTVLGAGGSAAAVVVALEEDRFAEVRVHGRTPSRAAALCARFPSVAHPVDDLKAAVRGAELVVITTPQGLESGTMPVEIDALDPGAVVLDLVVARDETHFVRVARSRGHRAADGLEMLLAQGALAFERWFGVAPDRDAMRQAVAR